MKLAALLLLISIPAAAELPEAPTPQPAAITVPRYEATNTFTAKRSVSPTDAALWLGVVATRSMDYFSTEPCVHSTGCHEALLPPAIVDHKGAFISFETLSAIGSIMAERTAAKHGHARLAKWVQLGGDIAVGSVAIHNFTLRHTAPTPVGRVVLQ